MTPLYYGPNPRVAILISGRGSNMQAIVWAKELLGVTVVGVVSSNAKAPGLALAEAAGVPTAVIASRDHKGDRAAYDAALTSLLGAWRVDLIVLAGFMRILSDAFVTRFAWHIINIHPSLLPAFPGLDPHGQAVRAGVKVSGCTVHFVAAGQVDAGPIIAQRTVPVDADDTAETLASRVLVAEHRLYPSVIAGLARGEYFRRGALVFSLPVGD